jgi:trigger factor
MNVTKEMTGDLTAVLKVEVSAADYMPAVEAELKKYRKKANIPGFRPGQVPMGMIKKMYETPVRAEEVQKVMSDAMYQFVDDNKLELLGSPMSNDEKTGNIDWEKQEDFVFYFDIAMQPEFQLELGKQTATYYKITPDQEAIEKQIGEIQRRFGSFETPEAIEETDLVYGQIKELDAEGNVKEGGVQTVTSIAVDKIGMATIKKKFIGAKKDDAIVFNLAKAFKNNTEIAAMLRIDSETAKEFKSDVQFTVHSISRVTPHEVNEELYEKAFPGKEIKTDADFKAAIKEEMEKAYSQQADRHFLNEVSKQLVETSTFELPDEFLKRWLIQTNTGKVENKEIEDNYTMYRDSIKWQLVESKLMEQYKLEVSKEEVKTYYKEALISNYFPKAENETEEQAQEREAAIEKIATNMLENKEQGRQIYEFLFDQKLTQTLKENVKLDTKEVSLDEFSKILNK